MQIQQTFVFLIYQQLYNSWKQVLHGTPGKQMLTAMKEELFIPFNINMTT